MSATPAVTVYEKFLADQITAALFRPAYIGSEAHRQELESFAQTRVPAMTVTCGTASYWEPGRIVVLRPVGFAPEIAAEQSALVVLHETLHEKHSRPPGAKQVYERLRAFERRDPGSAPLATAFLNWLEDERVSRHEATVEPGLRRHLDLFSDMVVAQQKELYSVQFREAPWTDSPASAPDQFLVALVERIFGRGRSSPVKATVAAAISDADSLVDAAVNGTLFDVADSAFALVDVYARRRPL